MTHSASPSTPRCRAAARGGAIAAWLAISAAAGHAGGVAVGSQYDTTHVYVAPADVDKFVDSVVATFGGHSTKQVVATVTPTPSSTTSQLVQTPVGTISVFGFRTPVPFPFGLERNGYLVTDLDAAIQQARAAGADVLVAAFPDPIGRDAIVQWPSGVNMQLYWHTTAPAYAPFETVPENRVYVSPDRVAAFVRSFTTFSQGKVVSDDRAAPGAEIGRAGQAYRRVRIESPFGRMQVLVTDGQLPYPYGRESTGYAVANVAATLAKAQAAGVAVLVPPFDSEGRTSAMVEFPGGYVAEIHGDASTSDTPATSPSAVSRTGCAASAPQRATRKARHVPDEADPCATSTSTGAVAAPRP